MYLFWLNKKIFSGKFEFIPLLEKFLLCHNLNVHQKKLQFWTDYSFTYEFFQFMFFFKKFKKWPHLGANQFETIGKSRQGVWNDLYSRAVSTTVRYCVVGYEPEVLHQSSGPRRSRGATRWGQPYHPCRTVHRVTHADY